MFRENRVLKYFEKFTVKYQSRSLFFSKVTKHLLTVASNGFAGCNNETSGRWNTIFFRIYKIVISATSRTSSERLLNVPFTFCVQGVVSVLPVMIIYVSFTFPVIFTNQPWVRVAYLSSSISDFLVILYYKETGSRFDSELIFF